MAADDSVAHAEQFGLRWKNHHDEMFRAFQQHRFSETLADVTLVCEGAAIKAHKLILSACSTHFQNLFELAAAHPNGGPGGHLVLVFGDADVEMLRYAIEFMYTGELEMPSTKLSKFVALAEKWEIKGLRPDRDEAGGGSGGGVGGGGGGGGGAASKEEEDSSDEEEEALEVEPPQQAPLPMPQPSRNNRHSNIVAAEEAAMESDECADEYENVENVPLEPPTKRRRLRNGTPTACATPPTRNSNGGGGGSNAGGKMAANKSLRNRREHIPAVDDASEDAVMFAPKDEPDVESELSKEDAAETPPGDLYEGGDAGQVADDEDSREMNGSGTNNDLVDGGEMDQPAHVPSHLTLEGPAPEVRGLFRGRDARGRLVYFCGFCQYVANKKGHGVDHVQSHLGVRPYACTTCGRGFTRKQHLRKHETLHLLRNETAESIAKAAALQNASDDGSD